MSAFLDVTEALLDPYLTESFSVVRREEAVTEQGRESTINTIFSNVIGVVTIADPNDLDRPSEYGVFTRTISVISKFRLRGEVAGYLPDVVLWRGDHFVVKHIDLYPQFGVGFYQTVCTSMDRVDVSTDPSLTGKLRFNYLFNSGYITVI